MLRGSYVKIFIVKEMSVGRVIYWWIGSFYQLVDVNMGIIVSKKEGKSSSVCSLNVWKEEEIISNYNFF